VLLEPLLIPLAIGVVGAIVLWSLQQIIPQDAPDWVRPPAWLLPVWLVGIGLAIGLGILGQTAMTSL